MAQKILSSSAGYFYINELAIPKGSVYFKRGESDDSVSIYPLEKDSRLVIGTIKLSEVLNGDDGNSPFTYEALLEWLDMNTAGSAAAVGGGGAGDGTPIDTTNLATRQNQSTQITRETEIRDNIIAVLAKMIANPATADNQQSAISLLTSISGEDFATQAGLTAIVNKLSSDPATQTTLAEVLAKLIPNPATADHQTTQSNLLTSLNGKDFATQATLLAVLNKLTADPATQAGLTAILNKLIANPATSDNQTSEINLLTALTNKDFATQATAASILSKLSNDPATQTTLLAVLNKLPTSLDAGGGLKIFQTNARTDGQKNKASSLSTVPASDSYGQATMSASQPVVIASNQTDLPVLERVKSIISDPSTFRTIQTGGVAQIASAANAIGRFVRVINQSNEVLYISEVGDASPTATDNITLLPGSLKAGGVYESTFKLTNQISIYGATTGSQYSIINY